MTTNLLSFFGLSSGLTCIYVKNVDLKLSTELKPLLEINRFCFYNSLGLNILDVTGLKMLLNISLDFSTYKMVNILCCFNLMICSVKIGGGFADTNY